MRAQEGYARLALVAAGISNAALVPRGPMKTPGGLAASARVMDAPPAITQQPQLFGRLGLEPRAVGFDNTCGWYNADSSQAVTCRGGATCTTSSTILDCCMGGDCRTSTFDTACLDADACTGLPASERIGTYCCTFSTDRPYCKTLLWSASKNADTKLFFNCAATSTSRVSTLYNYYGGITDPPTPITTPTPPPTDPPADPGLPKGPVIGGIVGGVVGIALVGAAAYLIVRRRRAKASATATNSGGSEKQQQQQEYMNTNGGGNSGFDPRYSAISSVSGYQHASPPLDSRGTMWEAPANNPTGVGSGPRAELAISLPAELPGRQ